MAVVMPKLDVYFIDFSMGAEKTKSGSSLLNGLKGKSPSELFGAYMRTSVKISMMSALGPIGTGMALSSVAKAASASLKRLTDENRFYIIKNEEELAQFENACGNDWFMGEKALRQKQYYIRHPKKAARNLLIESQHFYEYIEQEEKDELIDFIMSHCNAKTIQIDRSVATEGGAGVKANVEGLNLSADASGGKNKGNYFSYNNPNGAVKTEPREEYFWVDKSVMRSIAALGEGATLTQTYEKDYRFGLDISEASTIGLNLNWHKKFVYTIHIEC